MHPPKVEVIRVMFSICRTCHEGRPQATPFLSMPRWEASQTHVRIGSECRLAGASQVFAVFTMCSARYHRSLTRSKRVVWKLFSYLPPCQYEQCV